MNGQNNEAVFSLESANLKFGNGAFEELGWELNRLGLKKPLLFADPRLRSLGIIDRAAEILARAGIPITVYDRISVEPTIDSFGEAARFAAAMRPDCFIALGGGSTIDTAKVANLISTHGGEIIDYVNPPVGGGRKPQSPLAPLIAIPTTSGSGSEATTVAILDIPELKIKTGISHRYLRPALAIVDPELARSTPPAVTASCGLDVVCHAVESYISKPFDARPKPATPDDRPPYQGSNPIADIWSLKAIEFGGQFLRRAVKSGNDLEARGTMMLGATMAGIGFGTAGVHIPHACAYPLAGLKHKYRAEGYETTHNFIPHGFSVIVTAPAAFRYTFDAAPEKHIKAAELLRGASIADPGPDSLPSALIDLMRDVGAPSGIAALGYEEADIPALVEGALKQQRLLVGAPKPIDAKGIDSIFRASFANW
ncbi:MULTISPECIES: hydroxyacid-oxoacid transhydrogenase [Mesorhizobium]|uniref:hydroxyacid-oxoacid transhydrogenase n=1 Tax=Mesorhizobium denitrificans TaxID=2294114 RepID=A0A371XJB6_9HYPH|nr:MULTISPECIES: hydroxyacid-oxoacid transhydrogenase [Mesorhizobium]RFC69154.1 iron-containing alcohol dehydrogenase [Mesorhizobium denitrificans]